MVERKVFISHAGTDSGLSLKVDDLLTANGYIGIMYERDFPLYSDFIENIANALYEADIIICLISSAFFQSNWCMRELSLAHSLGKLMPVFIQKTDEMKVLVDSIAHLDVTELDESDILEMVENALADGFLVKNLTNDVDSIEEIYRLLLKPKIAIALLDFSGYRDDESLIQLQQDVVGEIEYTVMSITRGNAEIIEIDKHLDNAEEAREFQTKLGADFIFWGYNQDGKYFIEYVTARGWEIPIERTPMPKTSKTVGKSGKVRIDLDILTEELESGDVKVLDYIIYFAFGALEFSRNRFEQALQLLTFGYINLFEGGLDPKLSMEKAKLAHADELLILRASVHRFLGKNDSAKSDLLQAIRVNSLNPFAHQMLAHLLLYEYSSLEDAMLEANIAIGINPDIAEAYTTRSEIYRQYDKIDLSLSDDEMAYMLGDDGSAAYRLGHYYFARKDYHQALIYFTEGLKLKPNYGPAICIRGYTLEKMSRFGEALKDYNLAIRLYPNYSTALFHRGLFYFHRGEYDSAIVDFQKHLAVTLENREVVLSLLDEIKALRR